MRLIDSIGNELVSGDAVSVRPDFVVGQIVHVEDGSIVRGFVTGDGKPAGQTQPHVVIKIEQTMVIGLNPAAPVGQVPVLKVAKPEASQ